MQILVPILELDIAFTALSHFLVFFRKFFVNQLNLYTD